MVLFAVSGSQPASATVDGVPVTSIKLDAARPYTPHAPPGATDDYHCTLVNPHLKTNSFIVSVDFSPGKGSSSVEVHHSILFLVPHKLAAAAEAADTGGKGWTCFGESPLPGTSFAQVSNTPWLGAWAPGHGADVYPTGTGMPIAAGSLIVMQVHYNLLLGDKPVKPAVTVNIVPGTTPLRPLSLDLDPAPPDIPCPAGATGPLCSRAAELQNLGQRFGQAQVQFVNFLESFCGRNPNNPPVGDSTSCNWPVFRPGRIVMLTAHMHLLGRTMTITLNPGTPSAKTLLYVPDYNFHYQRSYTLKTPVAVGPGDTIQVKCTYDPTLEQELPSLRNIAPHFVTWGDGSTDEMCLGIITLEPPVGGSDAIDWANV